VARRSERVSARRLLVVLGMMGRCPFGGQTWLYLNWLRGLSRLGHDVWYVEDDATWPYDPRADAVIDDPTYAAAVELQRLEWRTLVAECAFAAAGAGTMLGGGIES